MKIHILAISDSDKDFRLLVDEYTKRLGQQVTVVNVKPVKHGTTQQIVAAETDQLIEKIDSYEPRDWSVYLLSKDGKLPTSEGFAKLVSSRQCLFLIGGPYGLDEAKLDRHLNDRIAFGRQTMPHGLAKVVLLEQVWRAHCINTNRPYHY